MIKPSEITEYLKKRGLYAQQSYNSFSIPIKRIEDDTIVCELTGDELYGTGGVSSNEDVFELIKKKLGT